MATITDSGFPSLAEVASRSDPSGATSRIANVLMEKNPMIEDISWHEGNRIDGHSIKQTDTSLPTPSWRTMNQGIAATKGKTVEYLESCGLLEDHSVVDEMAVERNGGAAWRESEDLLKMDAIPQYFAEEVLYESVATNPERIHGLTPRYPATSGYINSAYVKIGTNAGVNCRSVWLVTWAPRKIYGIFPKGTKAGLSRIPHPEPKLITNSDGTRYFGFITQFKWWCGIAVEDYRYAVRFQWDPDDPEMAAGERGLIEGILDMQDIIYEVTPQTRYYADRTTIRRMKTQLRANEASLLTWLTEPVHSMPGDPASMGGKRMRTLDGITLRTADALSAETYIS